MSIIDELLTSMDDDDIDYGFRDLTATLAQYDICEDVAERVMEHYCFINCIVDDDKMDHLEWFKNFYKHYGNLQ